MKFFKNTMLIIVSISMLLLAACTNSASQGSSKTEKVNKDGKIEIELWHGMPGLLGESLNEITKNFNEKQDKYVVKSEFQGTYEELFTKLRSVGGTKDAPAISQVYNIGTKNIIESGFMEPMQTFIDKYNFDLSQLEKNTLNYYTVDGKLYSMPFNSSTPVMIYNKDAFRKAGLDPEKPPQTFSEVVEAAAKLKTDSMAGFSMLTNGFFFEALVATQGALYVNEGNGREGLATEAVFNGEEGYRVFEWLDKMNKAGTFGNFGTNWDDILSAFSSGKVAMYLDSSGDVVEMVKNSPFEVGVAYLPHPDGVDRQGVIMGGASLWMAKGMSDQEQEAAWEFMKYLTTPEVQAKWHADTGYFAINPAAYKLDTVKEKWKETPQLQVTIQQLQDTKPSLATQGALISVFPESRKYIVTALEDLYQGKAPKTALDEAAKGTNKAIETANKTKK